MDDGPPRVVAVLPAYAGMIPVQNFCFHLLFRAPRLRGDDPRKEPTMAHNLECSPPTRG